MQPKTIKSKNNGCGNAPGNLVNYNLLITKNSHGCIKRMPKIGMYFQLQYLGDLEGKG